MEDRRLRRLREAQESSLSRYVCTYRICPYRSRAQIEAGGQKDKSLIEAGSRIVAGSRTGVSRESIANRDRYASRSTRLHAKLVGNLS